MSNIVNSLAVGTSDARDDGRRVLVNVQFDGADERHVVVVFIAGTRIPTSKLLKGQQYLLFEFGEGFAALPAGWADADQESATVALARSVVALQDRVNDMESRMLAHIHADPATGFTGPPLSPGAPPGPVPPTSPVQIEESDPLEVTHA